MRLHVTNATISFSTEHFFSFIHLEVVRCNKYFEVNWIHFSVLRLTKGRHFEKERKKHVSTTATVTVKTSNKLSKLKKMMFFTSTFQEEWCVLQRSRTLSLCISLLGSIPDLYVRFRVFNIKLLSFACKALLPLCHVVPFI